MADNYAIRSRRNSTRPANAVEISPDDTRPNRACLVRERNHRPIGVRNRCSVTGRRTLIAVGIAAVLFACLGFGSCSDGGGTLTVRAPTESAPSSTQQQPSVRLRDAASTTATLASSPVSSRPQTNRRQCVTPNCTEIDECAVNPCQNGATCEDRLGSHHCICPDGYTGLNCSEDIDECLSSPCLNGGTCLEGVGTFICECPPGFLGPNCSRDVDECISSPCLNGGECSDKVGGYECHCTAGWNGTRCEIDVDECHPSPCQNRGRCEDMIGDYKCNCLKPWGGKNCEINSEPCLSSPCRNNATCTNGHHPGNFTCSCASGFTGELCEVDLDECESNPCTNGGHCTDLPGGFKCRCVNEYGGPTCAEMYDDCMAQPCHNGGTCHTQLMLRNSTCSCADGYTGQRCTTRIDGCQGVACPPPHVCHETTTGEVGHRCQCPAGFEGPDCEINIDECAAGFVCHNGGTCVDVIGNVTCRCPHGFRGDRCEISIDECDPGSNGTSPCQWGICKSTPGSFQCYCQPGYTGALCDQEYNECLSQPCRNGGSCRDLVSGYKCLCPIGYTGRNCETDINECASAPCSNGGSCVDGVGTFRCRCQLGFTGLLCEQDIDECASQPCLHSGQCVDHVNNFTCNCSDTGFRGDLCQDNIDECASNPCVNEAHCLDLVKDYSCQCHLGFEGKNCENDVAECSRSPCQNDGECLEKSNSTLYMLDDDSRPPGFPRGQYRPATSGGYICVCQRGFVGIDCEVNVDDCQSSPCQHGGRCVDGIDSYTCDCRRGFEGQHCESEIDECRRYRPCAPGSTCINEFGDYVCNCPSGIGGKNCTVPLAGCERNDCQNGATCVPYLVGEEDHRRNCTCDHGFYGAVCEHSTTISFDRGANYMLKVMGTASRPYTLYFRFRTTLANGILALAHGLSHHFQLFLVDGSLHFTMPDATLNVSAVVGDRLNDGRWRAVRVAVTGTGVDIDLAEDGSGGVVGVHSGGSSVANSSGRHVHLPFGRDTRVVPHFSLTDIGGIEQWMHRGGWMRVPNYLGCMQDVEVSGGRVVPGVELVQAGAQVAYLGSVIHGCPRTEQCLPSTCNGGGKCVDLWTNYTCQCARPRFGLHCENEYEAVTFGHENSSNSYADISLSEDVRGRLRNNATVSLFLRTRQQDGVIFYLGNGNSLDGAGEEDTFLAAQLQGGVLRLSVKINGTPESLMDKSQRRLDDGYYHFLQVSLLNRTLSALLNGTTLINNMEVDAHRDRHLKATNLFLGGLDSPGPHQGGLRNRRQFGGQDDPLSADLESSITDDPFLDLPPPPSNTPVVNPAIFFKGVMQDIRLNDQLVEVFPLKRDVIPAAESVLRANVTKVNILEGVQSDDVCLHLPCQNGSTCSNTWNDYHCECPIGFRGKNCSDLEFCAFNKCPATSQCRSLSNGYECVSNATFNGVNSSVGYMLVTDQAMVSVDKVSIHFRSQHGGPVLHVTRGNSFFEVGLENSTSLRLRWSTTLEGVAVDEESTTIPLKVTADDDSWHSLQVTIGDVLSVRLEDDEPIVATADVATLTMTLAQLATTKTDSDAPPLRVILGAGGEQPDSKHYRGCLGEVRLGGILLPFFPRTELANDSSSTYFETVSVARVEVGECLLCYDSECQHGSACLNRRDSRSCNCSHGYEGQFCQVNVDECAGVTCDNGGTCKDEVAAFSCQCVPGYEGDRCEHDIDECASDPCQNGGKCNNLLDNYSCNCTANYTGFNCENEKAFDCSTQPCPSGATCVNTNLQGHETPGFKCLCQVGRTGPVCETEIDFCESNTCAGGSTCHNEANLGQYKCACVTGFEGNFCSEKINYCQSKPCLNDGLCRSRAEDYSCSCTPNYTGINCELDVNECEDDPCENNGTCTNVKGTYSCQCTDGYVGKNCSNLNPCNDEFCKNGGTCWPSGDNDSIPKCNCTGKYEGANCELEIQSSGLDGETLGIVIGSVVAATILIVIAVLTVFLTMAKKKRATRGTYSPSRQEMFGSRVEMGNVMKPPPEERLI